MLLLVIGLIVFIGIHLLPTAPQIRNGVVERYGANTYKLAFSVIALIGLTLIVLGYGRVQGLPSKNPDLWNPPLWTRHIAYTLMPISFILLAAAYIPSRIKHVVKHPMLAAVKIWALAHLITNGDSASLLLFGSLLAFAVYDRISVKHRTANAAPPAPDGYSGDIAAIAIGFVAFVVMLLWGHARLIGVPLVPGWA